MTQQDTQYLDISHAFINILSATYQGMFVFFNAMDQLSDTDEWKDDRESVAETLDTINSWWADFRQQKPLVTESDRSQPSDAFNIAWKLLEVARDHHRWSLQELAQSSRAEVLMENPPALHIRAASSCGAAYARWHYIQGLICYGEVLDREDVADRWRQQLLSAQSGMNRGHTHLELAREMRSEPREEHVSRILDETCNLPAVYGQRVVDITEVFSLFTGKLDYQDAGIPSGEEGPWMEAQIPPAQAGRWYIVGMTAEQCAEWVRGGVPDPVIAFDFILRDFWPDEAGPWFAEGFSAADAKKWSDAGYSAEQAAAFVRDGVREPAQAAK